MKLRVMTYNIRWGLGTDRRYDLERVAAVIAAVEPDLVGLQEIERGSPRSRFRDQPALLGRRLGMHVAFGPSLCLGSWQFGNALLSRLPIRHWRHVGLPVPSRHSPLFAARSRKETSWEELSSESLSRRLIGLLPGTAYMRRWLPGLFDRRGVLLAEIGAAEPGDGPVVTALVTHLPLRREVRMAQAEAILTLLATAGEATLLLGDFNEGPRGAAVGRFRDQAGLTDLSGSAPTFPSTSPTGKIDFIMGGGAVRALGAARVLSSPASDHLPVIVDVEVARASRRSALVPDPGA